MNATTPSPRRVTMRQLQIKEQEIFRGIPGMKELLGAKADTADRLRQRYPDAAFALMTAENLFTGDREQNMIHQKAYFSILAGDPIPGVRFRYDRDMDRYVSEHMWD